ncbi:MAG: nucleotidyltransferase domain-containing protein, partial [Rhodocyclaceae bacterium]|nr:nucleotidyltransferase domain-containing protein [Rhodocyclaceae bacterium]
MFRPDLSGYDDSMNVQTARTLLQEGQASLRAAYERHNNAVALLRGRTRWVDRVLCDLWKKQEIPDEIALVAVGGYGRGELYPASDIDLLLLVPEGLDVSHHPRIESLIGKFWDSGLDIGHSVRTINECLHESAQDITIQTALLEVRPLCGDAALFSAFCKKFRETLDPIAFFKAKELEQEERYARYQDTPYSLEPHCKESPGGLRDLQMIRWLANATGLKSSPEDSRELAQTETFLRHIRIRMHYLAGRREDRLLFEFQERLAASYGIQASAAKRASEILMQRYYRNAKRVTQLNSLAIQSFTPPLPTTNIINEYLQIKGDMLDIRDDAVFEHTPSV